MKHFRKIWDQKKHDFLMEHREMPIDDCYQLFLQTFPDAHDVTSVAFRNERSRIGAISEKYKNSNKNHGSRVPRPLFSEHEKKGFIRIKVGQPNEWMFKQHYVWWKNTGYRPEPKKEMVIFLDGNKRNFDFKNLFLIQRKAVAIFNNPYLNLGTVRNNPELTKINALNAMLIVKTRELGKKHGLVYQTGAFKDDYNRKIKEGMTEEKRVKRNEITRKSQKKKREYLLAHPEEYEEFKRKQREYQKSWAKKRRKKS